MNITSRDEKGIPVLRLRGPMDIDSAGKVEASLGNWTEGERVRVVVDLTDVDRVDSAGLGALLAAANAIRKRGGVLKICSAQSTVLKIMNLTGFTKILEYHASAAEAVASFG
jgi:anti-anti-sigma factor